VVQRGSVGIKVCMVATAEVDLYVHVGGGAKLWDAAAPEAILRAAGGAFTDWSGAPIDYRGPDLHLGHGIVASNGLVHEAALETIRRLGSPA
jgi:3'(2'), 5'-bisphosphate nucleotidase